MINPTPIFIFFFVISMVLGLLVGLIHSKTLARLLTSFYVIIHVAFTIFCWMHRGETVLDYFTFDTLGLLLQSVLSILTVTTVFHGFIYVRNNSRRTYAIYLQ